MNDTFLSFFKRDDKNSYFSANSFDWQDWIEKKKLKNLKTQSIKLKPPVSDSSKYLKFITLMSPGYVFTVYLGASIHL